MSRKISLAPDEFYHLYNRGTDKRIIFNNNRDRDRFIYLLYLSNGTRPFHFNELKPDTIFSFDKGGDLTNIVSYCLMDNHFHILVQSIDDTGISVFMHKLATAYTMYFNKINNRKGRLFETNFQVRHIDSENYLKYIHSYIHLNPIKIVEPNWKEVGLKNNSAAKQFLNNYTHSSYLDYAGNNREEQKILNKTAFPYFEDKKEFEEYLEDWLTYRPEA